MTTTLLLVLLLALPSPDDNTTQELARLYAEDQDDQNNWDRLGDAEAGRRQGVRGKKELKAARSLLKKWAGKAEKTAKKAADNEKTAAEWSEVLKQVRRILEHKKARALYQVTLDRMLLALGRTPVFTDEVPEGSELVPRAAILELPPKVRKLVAR